MILANLLFGSRKMVWTSLSKYAAKNIRNFSLKETRASTLINSDNISQDLKSAVNTRQVLHMVSTNLPQFQNIHIMQTLKVLFQLQKLGSSEDIINNEDFELLCRKLKKNCRALEINDSIEALKILMFLGVPCNSAVTEALLQLIKHSVNTLSQQHIIFLDFLLRKFQNPTPLAEALLISLPLVFEIQLQTVIDHENVDELIEYLQFASRNSLAPNCIQSIVSALTIHGEELPIYAAKSVVWSLSELKNFELSHCRLLENALKVIKKNIMVMNLEDVEITLLKMQQKYIQDNQYFYDEEYFDKCAEYIILNKYDILQTIWVLRKLTRLGHMNIPLLNYIGEQIVQQPELLSKGRPLIFFTIVASFAFADYKPNNWEIIRKAIMSNELLTKGKDELPWTKCAVDMAALDCYNDNLLRRIFSPIFLKKFLARDFNALDYLQLLYINQAVKTLYKSYEGPFLGPDIINHAMDINKPRHGSPIESALIKALDNEKFVANGILSKLGHVIDHVVVMRNGTPLPVCSAIDQDVIYIEDIVVPQDSTIICIMCLYRGCFATNSHRLRGNNRLMIQTLEAMDYKVLPISMHVWRNLQDREKIPYLLQGINERCIDCSN